MSFEKIEARMPRTTLRRALTLGLLCTTSMMTATIAAQAQQAPSWLFWEEITAISADGSRFVGNLYTDGIGETGFLGREGQAGAMSFTPFGNYQSVVMGLNGAGNAAVGYANDPDGRERAFRWTEQGGSEILGVLIPSSSGARSIGMDISGDGRKVVGYDINQGRTTAFVWIEGTNEGVQDNEQMYALPRLTNGIHAVANAISDDGRYVVGWSESDTTTGVATRWSIDGLGAGGTSTIRSLGSLTSETGGNSRAYDVSADGRVVVGYSVTGMTNHRAFRWVEGSTTGVAANVQMHDLGTLGGQDSNAYGVSRDGNVVVGDSRDASEVFHAFRWTEATGMEAVASWLKRNGVDVGEDRLEKAVAVSDDGNVVAGTKVVQTDDGPVQRAYIARVAGDKPGGLMDVDEYNASLLNVASLAQSGEYLAWLPMNGAHHRPLMLTPGLDNVCAWSTGDLGHHSRTDTGVALAEVGGCATMFDGTMRAGIGVGTSHSWQDLSTGGSAELSGHYVLGELNWKPAEMPLLFSVTAMYGGWNADISRNYTNGGAVDTSRGRTDVDAATVRLRADWVDARRFGNTSLTPWASLAFGRVGRDAYSETGGAFPAHFNADSTRATEARLGLTAVTTLSDRTTLGSTVELAQRWGSSPTVAGQVDGLFGFEAGGADRSNLWVRAGADLDHKISDNFAVSGSVHAATHGGDATISGSLGLRLAF